MSERKTKTKKNGGSSPASTLSRLDLEFLQLTRKSKQKKRTYYQKKLAEHGLEVDIKTRSFKFKFTSLNEIPVGPRYYVRQLIRLGITRQLSLF